MDGVVGLGFPILMDGALGTQLAARGLEMSAENNLTHPDAVLAIHRSYAEAGCDILTANTFPLNSLYAKTHGISFDLTDANIAGVRLARAAAVGGQRVLGGMISTGQILTPYGECGEEEVLAAYRAQAETLASAGVDGFLLEAMMDVREALCAARACRAVADLPTILSFAFTMTNRGPRTLMGNSVEEISALAAEADVAAVGANCGDFDPPRMVEIVAAFRNCSSLPIIAQPNGGKPSLFGHGAVFEVPSEAFGEIILDCLRAGASIVGGCCGTAPEHIRCARQALRKAAPKEFGLSKSPPIG